ncbi:MAG: ribonucleotide reductase N-terminal alpha domain-containing protein, partial [Chloroflexota bacterium]|nr:ribonucleotide reductase N-terminal alpha domain-containing protein [Chloroflexota bacterium]
MADIDDLLKARYYQEGETQWGQIAERVANQLFPKDSKEWQETRWAIQRKKFMPSSPVLMNAGTQRPMMSSCFVLPIEDDIDAIMNSLHNTVRIQKYGGGVGINFSPIRPEGSKISTTGGKASGPVSFMKFWNCAMQVIRQAGKRQGALMGVLNWDHPDLDRFIEAKKEEGILTNFNLSLGLDEAFWEMLEEGDEYAQSVLSKVAKAAYNNGEPGVLFLDRINENSAYHQRIEATNPCGEVPIPPYGACCLGSINLKECVVLGEEEGFQFDWEEFLRLVDLGIHVLDRVVAKSWWPIPEIEEFERQHWPLGLGVMGLADTLALLEIPYASEEAQAWVDRLMRTMRETADAASKRISEKYDHPRHATVMSIAPTGSISMLAGCSYSIEPYFTLSGVKNVEQGTFAIQNGVFQRILDLHEIELSNRDRQTISETGSVQSTSLPPDIKRLFLTATEMAPEWHISMQSIIQSYVDNSVSKTINLP